MPVTADHRHPSLALVHDYLTQRGGAERVALLLAETFPDAPLHTSLYLPSGTFPEFSQVDIRPLPINRVPLLRHHHRLALPLLAPSFSLLNLNAEVILCSSSGWAHGARTAGRKIVYCYAPARWLYQSARYMNRSSTSAGRRIDWRQIGRRAMADTLLRVMGPPLRRWDRRAAHSADSYLTSSTEMAAAIRSTYGIDAQILPPPPTLDPVGVLREIPDLEPGFHLCIARLLPYKNVDVVIEAMADRSTALVVVGDGPEYRRLADLAGPNIRLLGRVDDSTLRWLYRNCSGLVAAAYEDYGLTPLEAAAFGKPSVVLRAGGFLDTVIEGETGVFFDEPTAASLSRALDDLSTSRWDPAELRKHADRYSQAAFCGQIRRIVEGG